MRLTEPQWRALDALHAGECQSSRVTSNGLVAAAAVWSLYRFGYAECPARNCSRAMWRITEAGRVRWAEIVTERAAVARATFTEIPA